MHLGGRWPLPAELTPLRAETGALPRSSAPFPAGRAWEGAGSPQEVIPSKKQAPPQKRAQLRRMEEAGLCVPKKMHKYVNEGSGMMLAPWPPLGPAAPRGGAALCVCLASRGLTVLWKVCFVNIVPVFFSVSDSRGDGEKEKAAHDPAHPPREIPQSQPARPPPGSGRRDVPSLRFLFLF